jgi:hypothetical protein
VTDAVEDAVQAEDEFAVGVVLFERSGGYDRVQGGELMAGRGHGGLAWTLRPADADLLTVAGRRLRELALR